MGNPADAYLDQTLAGRYRVVDHLADGTFAHVFKATDEQFGTPVAVKVLQPGAAVRPESPVEFEHEGVLLESLQKSRNVVSLTDSGQSEIIFNINQIPTPMPVSFHVLELADGTLSELLPHRHELDWVDKMWIFRGVVSGTHQMHDKRIMHRDLKASNVLLFDANTTKPIAKVSDLGRSRDLTCPPRFPTGSYAAGRGDMSYAPPEHLWHLDQTGENALRQADIYLLGSVLYEIATGQGITSMMLPDWYTHARAAANMSPLDREANFRAAGHHMTELHASALDLLAVETPPEIRQLVVDLVRQMCSPIPTRREYRYRAERKNPVWGLQWVIRRVDIIVKNLQMSCAMSPTVRKRRRQ